MKRAGSPGRYSLADEADAVPPTRIDSTTRMPAVRPDVVPKSVPGSVVAQGVPQAKNPPVASAAVTPSRAPSPPAKETKRKTPPPPARPPPAPKAPTSAKAGPPSSRLFSTGSPLATDVKPVDAKPSDAKVEAKRVESKPSEASAGADPKARIARTLPGNRPSRPPSIAPPGGRRVSSLRPPPGKVPSIDPPAFSLDGFDEGSIAFAFDALVSEDHPNQPGTHEFDLAPVRELFAELAANHMRHVRDFMIDVKWGEVTRDWIDICVPPVRTLRKAATHLELIELGEALERVASELDAANAVGGQLLDADEKQRLLDAYEELVKILPQAFALDRDKTQREAVIVQALLLQVPDVRKVTIDKLHAAGLTSLNVLFDANAHDVAHVADIPHALASRIVERVQAYRAELQSSSPQDARAAEREKLAGLNGQLKQHHDAYEQAANAWGPEAKAKKRDHFRAREETWLEISVLLARFGEVERLQGIEKVPFSQRIAQLSDYLEEARDKYRSPEP